MNIPSALLSPARYGEAYSDGQFKRPAHIRLIDNEVMRVLLDDMWECLIVQCPPRHGKSWFLSRWFPAWYHQVYAENNSILASYGHALARNNSRWVRDCVDQLAPVWGRKGTNPSARSASEWLTVEGGGMFATGVGGGATGRPANILLLDDIIKNHKEAINPQRRQDHWEWFQSTAFTRLEPGGKIIVLATRWFEDDLIGRLIRAGTEEGIGEDGTKLRIREVRLPALAEPTDATPDPLGRETDEALWPERYSASVLKRKRSLLEDYWWSSVFQQRPSNYGSNEWPSEYFWGIYAQDDEWPDLATVRLSACALDPSKGKDARKGDPSAIVYVGFKDGYLWVDADIRRRPIPDMVEDYILFNIANRPTIAGIEAVAFQELLADSYVLEQAKYNYSSDPELIDNTINKNIRIGRLGYWLRLHMIKVRNSAGGRELVRQMREFPNSDHDDGPDALEMALRLLIKLSDVLTQLDSERETLWTV